MYMIYVWLAVILISMIIEIADSGTLVSIWSAVGAIIPLFMALFKIVAVWYIIIQVVLFGVITALCIVFLRKVCKKFIYGKSNEKTNLDRHIGKQFKLTELEKGKIFIKINDIEFFALPENERETFQNEEVVEIVRFAGNKAIIKKID